VRFLLDTNVLIPLEPGGDAPVPLSPVAAEFHALVTRGGHTTLLHPAIDHDLDRDDDTARRARTQRLAAKYPRLPQPPRVTAGMAAVVGTPVARSNDWVDDQLLAAIAADAIDYLVTEDARLHRKGARLGLGHRIATVAESTTILRGLFDRTATPPPAVVHLPAYQLEAADPIFSGLRADYGGAEFDAWLTKARREGRDAWVIMVSGTSYAGVTIVKREDEIGLRRGRVLKISTLKVAEDHRGRYYGELLLKTLFRHAHENDYSFLYVEVFPRHEELVKLLEDFGFRQEGTTRRGEHVMVKIRSPESGLALTALEYQIRYGPPAIQALTPATYVVPVRPEYHARLFPDLEVPPSGSFQLTIFDQKDEPYGNALRKAYLCQAPIRTLPEGSILLFYRSQDARAITAVGILEAVLRSRRPDEIARFVGKRTVYSYRQIESLCTNGEVLAILFRQDRIVEPPLELTTLVAHNVISAAPQSISKVKEAALPWLQQRLDG